MFSSLANSASSSAASIFFSLQACSRLWFPPQQKSMPAFLKISAALKFLKEHPEISIALMQELSKRLRTADMQIKSLSLKDAEGKVATVIVQLANDHGRIRQGAVEIEKLPLQQDLANMAGTSRETISRTLHSFAKKGLIELEGSKLRIYQFDKFKSTYL